MFYWSTEIINQASSNEYDQIKQKMKKVNKNCMLFAIGIYPSPNQNHLIYFLFINKQFIYENTNLK